APGVMSYSAPLPLPPQWNVNSDGSWNASGNWSTNTVPQTSVEVDLLGVSTAPHTITPDGNHTVAILRFDNAKSYTIAPGSGGTLTIGDGTFGNIIVFIGTHEISAGVTFAGNVMKSGLGALTISGPQNHGPGAALNIIGGRVTLNSNAG